MKRIEIKSGVRVFVQDRDDPEPVEITDHLHWFEEQSLWSVDEFGDGIKLWIEIEEDDLQS